MIFDELVLHNFGVYRGRQVLRLSPPSNRRPVILIGGLNGTGKTTLLDAVQLALFGKLAACVNRTPGSYHQYLRATIHRATPPDDGAGVELAFRHQRDGTEHQMRVHRHWQATATSVSETLRVHRNGDLDATLSARWLQSVDKFVPLGISRLVFFDGEQIAALADPATSAEALAAGINGLLGIDALDQLLTDLSVYERRQRSKLVTAELQEPIRASEEKLRQFADERNRLVIERAASQNALDHARRRLDDCERQLHVQGGDLYERRAELESRRDVLSQRLQDARDDLISSAAGNAPLLQVPRLLRDLRRRAAAESAAAEAHRIHRLLVGRDRRVLATLRDHALADDVVRQIRTIFADDRRSRRSQLSARSFRLPDAVTHELARLVGTALPQEKRRLLAALKRTEAIQDELDGVDRDLAAVPDSADLATLLAARSTVQTETDASARVLHANDDALRKLRHRQAQERKRYEELLVRATTHALDHDDLHRTIAYSAAARDTLQQFRHGLLTRNTRRIASLVLDGLRHLLRKERLLSDLEIDPTSFRLTLRDATGTELPSTSLSAGERQLLAVSLLWGLARAANRPLPTIIDTPLSRLDSTHRTHIVEHYFPAASHQVLVLSTDEEITPVYRAKLRPHTGRTYTLIHDDRTQATRIEKGYFRD